jgi:dihydroflavonol-4-reductase
VKTFVTGGTGFLGTQVVKRLARKQHELICLARETSDTSVLEDSGATVVTGDITDKDCLAVNMQGCQWVVHLASSFVFWVPDRDVYKAVNIDGTRNVMEAALEAGVSKVVHVSTAAAYGSAPWPITEESPVGAVHFSEYARTKYEGDLVAWELYRSSGLPLVAVYPGAVIGANDPKAAGRYIKNMAQRRMPAQVLTDVVFPWVYVGDVAEAILAALEKEGNIGERYLLTGENLTFGEVNRMIGEIAAVPLPRLRLADFVTFAGAYVLTGLSKLTKKPPILDMSVDQIRLMKHGALVDGSKAERELGVVYTPIRDVLREAISSLAE